MEANITERRYSDDELQLGEPHFNEEATLLSAQPVVPLNEIREIRDTKPKAVSKKRLAFGLAILASLIIGAVGATLVFRQRGQRSTSEVAETAIAGSDAIGRDSTEPLVSTGEVSGHSSSRVVSETERADAPTIAPLVQKSQKNQRPVRNIPADNSEPESEELSQAEEREIRRAEKIEARRLRRMEAREERYGNGRGRRRQDELLRIREIFEGSRRP